MRYRYHFGKRYYKKFNKGLLEFLKENHIKVSPDKDEVVA